MIGVVFNRLRYGNKDIPCGNTKNIVVNEKLG